jgi:ELWxxDGT repeat protein
MKKFYLTAIISISFYTVACGQVQALLTGESIQGGGAFNNAAMLFDGGFHFWLSDGTPGGTAQVSTIAADPTYLNSGHPVIIHEGKFYFPGNDGVTGAELWVTDGTTAGTILLKDINPSGSSYPGDFVAYNGDLYFEANDGVNGSELWKTDGTTVGTVLVKDINPGPDGSGQPGAFAHPFVHNGLLYFTANTSATGTEPWRTDGTTAGTVLVKDIRPGPQNSNPHSFTSLGSSLIFAASADADDFEPWITDGTTANTHVIRDINPGNFSSIDTASLNNGSDRQFMLYNNKLFFEAQQPGTGPELWSTDGTLGGTNLVRDICLSGGGVYYFSSDDVAVANGKLLFEANNCMGVGRQLWATDGTAGGTQLIKEFPVTGTGNNNIRFLVPRTDLFREPIRGLFKGNRFFMVVTTDTAGRELWISDGTAAGTMMVKNINSGPADAFDGNNYDNYLLTADYLFFPADNGINGMELWRSDGTSAGTTMVADVEPGPEGSFPVPDAIADSVVYVNVNGDVYTVTGAFAPLVLTSNDNPGKAILLTEGVSDCNGSFSNGNLNGATAIPGEPGVSCESITGSFSSIWYKFVATSSMVKVSTDYQVDYPDSLVDTKMAIYSAANPLDFSTWQILGCDEDNGVLSGGSRSTMYVTGLSAGSTYYIKVDKGDAASVDGSICIDVFPLDPAMISQAPNCSAGGYGNSSGYSSDTWVSIVDNSGALIANIRSNSNDIGTVGAKFYENTGPVRSYNNHSYLDRNFQLNTSVAPAGPVDIRFFFTDAEYAALLAADPDASMANLGVTRLENGVCNTFYDPTGTNPSFLPNLGYDSENGVRDLMVQTPGFSAFVIHAGTTILPVRIMDISAVNVGPVNKINWKTGVEAASDRFTLQRSQDGTGFSSIAVLNARGTASSYEYFDERPYPGINYYRLLLTSQDGSKSYSKTVTATVQPVAGPTLTVYPNPVTTAATVIVNGLPGDKVMITLEDITGKTIASFTPDAGRVQIDMTGLAKGIYLIRYTDTRQSRTVKISK